jgi:hypothetical protein
MKSVSAMISAWPAMAVAGCMVAWLMLLVMGVGGETGDWLSSLGWGIGCSVLLAAPYLTVAALCAAGKRRLAMGVAISFLASFWFVNWSFLRFLVVHEFGIMRSATGALIADALAKSFSELEVFAAIAMLLPLTAPETFSRMKWLEWVVNLALPAFLALLWLFFFYAIHDSAEAAAGAGAGIAAILIAQLVVKRRMEKAAKRQASK